MKNLKKWKRRYVILTCMVMALAVCLIVWPNMSAGVLCILFGVILAAVGGMRIYSYFQRGLRALWHRYEFPLGILDMLLGIYFFTRPENVLLLVPVIVGIVIVMDSVFKLQTALELREMGMRRWWSVLLFAIISILFAVLLIGNPFEGTITLTIYLGVSLLIDAIQSLYFVHQIAKAVRELTPMDVEYVEVE